MPLALVATITAIVICGKLVPALNESLRVQVTVKPMVGLPLTAQFQPVPEAGFEPARESPAGIVSVTVVVPVRGALPLLLAVIMYSPVPAGWNIETRLVLLAARTGAPCCVTAMEEAAELILPPGSVLMAMMVSVPGVDVRLAGIIA